MDEAVIKQIQREGADALLDIGVSVPLKAFHIPFRKSPLELRVTMRRPYMSGQILFARTYLSMGITSEEMWGFSKEEEMQFLASHGKAVSRMVAYTLCRGPFSRRVLLRPVAWLIRNFMEQRYLVGCDQAFCQPDGYRPFYTYYQISRADESDELETEPKKEGELKSRYEGSHSPFGFVWQIASATGWSVDYILNKVNYQTLIMMLSDAPRYVRDKSGSSGPADERSAEDEADGIVGFFQSKLK